jgi:hypothetical protein
VLVYAGVVPDTPKNAELLHSGDTIEKHKRAVLGLGTLGTRAELRQAYAVRFLEVLATRAPNLVVELHSMDAEAWCQTHWLTSGGKPCSPVLIVAQAAQELHGIDPDLFKATEIPAGMPVPVIRSWFKDMPASACVIGPFWWNPFSSLDDRCEPETRTEAYNRICAVVDWKLRATERLAKHIGGVPADCAAEWFEWAVAFQVVGDSVPAIAKKAGDARKEVLDTRTVYDGIKRVLDMIGIDRRSEKPGRKPSETVRPKKVSSTA